LFFHPSFRSYENILFLNECWVMFNKNRAINNTYLGIQTTNFHKENFVCRLHPIFLEHRQILVHSYILTYLETPFSETRLKSFC